MSLTPNMINTAIGASPPWSLVIISNNEQSSSLSLSPIDSSSSNTTSVLSSVSSTKPLSLMSINLNDAYCLSSNRSSCSTTNNMNNNRWWPVDSVNRYSFKDRQHRVRTSRYNPFDQRRACDTRSAIMTRSNTTQKLTYSTF
ncbi:unnamed protein product [Rotaria sp. Silwood1]|nr:unnamed protein product [Rotaria sp. Silwood1]CAF4957899.1 unnamed protein product [Rotaria sp. Silwood1]CAF4970729.1 unnamed protein product [Rotaria sp. Silwood1]